MLPGAPSSDPTLLRAKPLDQMNSLRDMGHFPAPVHAGATLNVLITIAATFWVERRFRQNALALSCWIAVVLTLNLIPVVFLRAIRWRALKPMPTVARMNFFGDQHRFADWVYLAASANMAFWITLSWCAYVVFPRAWTLPCLLVLALACTFAPVWLRLLR